MPPRPPVISEDPAASGFEHLRGHKYCLLVTYKRNGEAVPTPVWFGLAGGRLYLRSEADAAKVKRVRNERLLRSGHSGGDRLFGASRHRAGEQRGGERRRDG